MSLDPSIAKCLQIVLLLKGWKAIIGTVISTRAAPTGTFVTTKDLHMLVVLLANLSGVGSGEEEVGPERHRQSSHVSHDPPMHNSPDANLGRVVVPCEFVLAKTRCDPS
jgi:hypothetical protein